MSIDYQKNEKNYTVFFTVQRDGKESFWRGKERGAFNFTINIKKITITISRGNTSCRIQATILSFVVVSRGTSLNLLNSKSYNNKGISLFEFQLV